MDFRQLEGFLTLARTLNFSRAAEELFVVQSALSQQIARLESELGARLFDRTSRRVVLTEAGTVLRTHAAAMLRLEQTIKTEFAELTGLLRGTLRIGVSYGVEGALTLPELLVRFKADYPGVRLLLAEDRSARVLDQIALSELDIWFVGRGPDTFPAGVHGVQLAWERIVALLHTGHPLCGREVVSLAELAGVGQLVESAPGTRLRALTDEAWEQAGLARASTLEILNLDQLIRYASAGLGAALVPFSRLSHLNPPARQAAFTVADIEERPGYPVSCAYRAPSPGSPVARRFLDILNDEQDGL